MWCGLAVGNDLLAASLYLCARPEWGKPASHSWALIRRMNRQTIAALRLRDLCMIDRLNI